MSNRLFIDASTFMALHSKDEEMRLSAKNFFAANFSKTIYMNLEEVGICDDLVWSFPRDIQDKYYPFMDNLHTLMSIVRVPYDAGVVSNFSEIEGLTTTENLLVATILTGNSKLVTFNEKVLDRNEIAISRPDIASTEMIFEESLERLYKKSLVLRL